MTDAGRLGRIQHHDPRNRGFAALDQPNLPRQPIPGRPWFTRDIFDQIGSSCTAAAASGVLRTGPFRQFGMSALWANYDTEQERFQLYRDAQQVDPWPGDEVTDPRYEGSSTDAPFRVLRDRGHIPGWRWLFGEAQLWEWVSVYAPAAVGVNFYNDMFQPDRYGVMNVSGTLAGGHAMRIVQAHQRLQRYRVANSWSRHWGVQGRAWITRDGMRRLLDAEGGEAVTIQMAA